MLHPMKKNIFKKSVHIFIFLLFTLIQWDVSCEDIKVEVREFDESALETFKNDPDFQYRESAAGTSFFQRIGDWLLQQIQRFLSLVFGDGVTSSQVRTFVYILLAAVAVFVVLKLLKINFTQLFYSKKNISVPYDVSEENIEMTDFWNLIREAVEQNAYPRAVRLLYLYALQMLSEKRMIHLKPGKTGYEYQYEIADHQIKESFSTINYYYQYVWYGNFPATESIFRKAEKSLGVLRSNIDEERS